ncbi:protein BOB1 [Monosporozyma unispora]|nr:polar growth protein [Kazachstania unispora]
MSTLNYDTYDPNGLNNTNKTKKKRYPIRIVVNTYKRRMDDELDLRPGDKVSVITDDEEYNDGWYFGKNLTTGKVGLFPRNFTQVMDNKDSIMNKKSHRRNSSLIMDQSNVTNDSFVFEASHIQKMNNNKNVRPEMVTTTMNDIDQALRALKNDSMDLLGESSSISTSNSGTITSTTTTSIPNEASFKFPLGGFKTTTKALETMYTTTANNITPNEITKNYNLDVYNVRDWSPNEVSQYFIKKGIDPKITALFEKHKINGSILLELELLHLKEIEIDSFGTRFTIFKEIEDLRKLNKKDASTSTLEPSKYTTTTTNNNNLLPAASIPPSQNYSNNNTPKETRTHYRSSSTHTSHSRKPSGVSVDKRTLKITSEKLAGLAISSNEHIFDSPGSAPKPPSYPSPVQPPVSPKFSNRNSISSLSMNKNVFPRERLELRNHTSPKLDSSFMRVNNDYKFGNNQSKPMDLNNMPASSSTSDTFKIRSSNKNVTRSTLNVPTSNSSLSSTPTPYSTTTSTRQSKNNTYSNQPSPSDFPVYPSHKKNVSGGSFVDLFNRISTMSPSKNDLFGDNESTVILERPSSVLYSHSRSSSGIPQHMRKSSQGLLDIKKHRRASSVLSFLSPGKNDNTDQDSLINMSVGKYHSRKPSVISSPLKQEFKETLRTNLDTPKAKKHRHSMFVSNSATSSSMATMTPTKKDDVKPKSVSTSAGKRPKSEVSTSNKAKQMLRFNGNSKKKTTAFLEGIRTITVDEAVKDATCYGWMHKKSSGAMGSWKKRFFTLHGTRLSYFGSLNDTKERGLIDITGHRVVPIKDDDKLITLHAATTRSGKYIFKLLPPQPGSKKGLTFTQPKVHYFAVDTKEDVKNWLSALIKANIDIDDSVPVVSSYAMPTISLNEAKQMLKDAKDEMVMREQEKLEDEDGQPIWEEGRKSTKYLSSNVL